MIRILQHRISESTLSQYIFCHTVVNLLHIYALNGLLSHEYLGHGVLSMNILDVLRARITENFPEIDSDELQLRVNYAYELIKHMRIK